MPSRTEKRGAFVSGLKRVLLALAAFFLGLMLAFSSTLFYIYTSIALKGNALTESLETLTGAVDCILVPGAQIYANRKPSPMLQDRLDGAVALFRAGLSDRILVSGDHREDNYNEPQVMYNYLIEQGIPDEAIFMDHYGLDTYDSIHRAKHVFGVESVIIATQRFHLQRALFIADRTGIRARGLATDPRVYSSEFYWFIRELGARVKAVYEVRTGAIPTYSSSPRPIGGDGRTTRDPF